MHVLSTAQCSHYLPNFSVELYVTMFFLADNDRALHEGVCEGGGEGGREAGREGGGMEGGRGGE